MSATTLKAPAAVTAGLLPISAPSAAALNPSKEGGTEKKSNINPELWQACAGPLISLPAAGTLVYYFPQGHSEQVAASMKKNSDTQIPNYPNLPSKLLCLLHSVTLHADPETDDVYAQMTLQPVSSYDREALLRSDLSIKSMKPQSEFFCKTLTASDTSTHGGFSVPRRAADKIFPPLDFSMQPPAQELVARDLHDNGWTFRHIYRGQPKRHLLTTGWSLFVSGKRLFAGDSVLFIRDEKQQLLLGIRRANRQSSNLSSSVLSSDSMHIGILAAAAHAAANNSPFTIFYNPRASPSEFVIPLAKYYKAMYSNQISLGMRFRMMFETEDSGTRRYMGTITGISDLDPVRWKSSQWRNLQVGWDESTAGERRNRVSIWEIEPVTGPFFICPPPFFRSKRPRQAEEESGDLDSLFKRAVPWLGDEMGLQDPSALSGLSLIQWMKLQQNSSLPAMMQPPNLSGPMMQNLGGADLSRQLGLSSHISQPNTLQFNAQRMINQAQQSDQNSKLPQVHPQILQQQSLPQAPIVPNLQQQVIGQTQFSSQENQMQLHLLQKLQQQQQSFHVQLHEQQKQLLDASQILPKPVSSSPPVDLPQQISSSLPLPDVAHQQIPVNICHTANQQQGVLPNLPSRIGIQSAGGSVFMAASSALTSTVAGQSIITDEGPSCSTSPSTNNCRFVAQPLTNMPANSGLVMGEDMTANVDLIKELQVKSDAKPSMNQIQGFLSPQMYLNGGAAQADYLDTSSSTTSVGISHNDIGLQNISPLPFSHHTVMMKDAIHDGDFQVDPRSMVSGNQIRVSENLGEGDAALNLTTEDLFANCETPKEPQQDLSASLISQPIGIHDMSFNSTLSESNILNRNAWPPAPQFQRMRTYKKVYKRGAVGRSVDITAYSGYDELKRDVARRFGIEGQLEDRQRVGWKLVYVDHENDILLVGDDPWEEFVNCVKCIKILSPQEVQQMSLDGDGGVQALPNQACSSSDNGNA